MALIAAHAASGDIEGAIELLEKKFRVPDARLVSRVLRGFRDSRAAGRWLDTVRARNPALVGELRLWSDLAEIHEGEGRDTVRVLASGIRAGAIAKQAGFHGNTLDFHHDAVSGRLSRKGDANPCVAPAMARALLAYHGERITATTHFVVGRAENDPVKQAVKAFLVARNKAYMEDPANPGRLIPDAIAKDGMLA